MMADFSAPKMAGLFLTTPELEQLHELVWQGYPLAMVLYVMDLRRYMDVGTGIVGDRRRICEQGLRETLEREAKRGPKGAPKSRSRGYIQRQLSALEKFGLIERLPKAAQFSAMRFYLPLAMTGLKAPQEMRTVMPTVKRTAAPLKIVSISDACNALDDKSAQQSAQQCGQHQEEITTTTGGAGLSMTDLAAVDLRMVVGLYHEVLPHLPPLRLWDSPAYRMEVARVWFMAPEGKHQAPDFWRWYFTQCAGSDFLMGRIVLDSRRGPFRANFKTLVTVDRVTRVINGEYT